jgi:hypothetical protein
MTAFPVAGWCDLVAQIELRGAGANNPAYSVLTGGIRAYEFSATAMNEVWAVYHVGHDYYPGSVMYAHTHWTTTGTNTGVVRWGFEWTAMKGYAQGAFGATATVYKNLAATGTALTHMISEVAVGDVIPATNLETDALILMRIFRDGANVADTCTDTAFLLLADLHYQSDRYNTLNRNFPFA